MSSSRMAEPSGRGWLMPYMRFCFSLIPFCRPETHRSPIQFRTYLMGSHNPSASSSVPEFNNAEFNSMLADFIQAANTSINQLQDRVQVLEEELKSLKQNHP